MRNTTPLPVLVFALLAAWHTVASAQPGDQTPPDQLARIEPSEIRPPALMVRPNANQPSHPLTVTHVNVEVLIAGNTAETTMTMTFVNPSDRVLEGDLYFPLPEGSVVTGYALDIDGQLMQAVVVEKHQARYIFEAEQRKGIDPGLVEWVQGNNFRTRVWPIPAHGARTIQVQHVSELTATENGQASYLLPLRFPAKLERLSVSARVFGDRKVSVRGGNWIQSQKQKNATQLSGTLENSRPQKDLVVTTAPSMESAHVARRPQDGRYYFVIRDTPVPPAVDQGVAKPQRIGLFWDVSLSREKADKRAELKLISKMLEAIGSVTVDVNFFSNKPRGRHTIAVKDGKSSELLELLKSAVYDGGTDLGNLILPSDTHGYFSKEFLKRSQLADPVEYDYHLLFTDGLDNLGGGLPARIHASRGKEKVAAVPVYAFGNDSRANHPLLRHLARSRGGDYFNLQQYPAKAVDAIVGSISHTPPLIFRLTKVEYDTQDVEAVFPNSSVRVQGQVSVAGILKSKRAEVKLHYAYGRKTMVKGFTLEQDPTAANRLVPRLWAQKKVDSMLAFPEEHRTELLQLGRDFGFVTPGTSLLVLETLDQYLEYGVEPPVSREKMHAEWTRRIDEIQTAATRSRKEKIDAVAKMWRERVEWWERDYKYPKDFKFAEKTGDRPRAEAANDARAGQAAPAPRSPEVTRNLATPNDAADEEQKFNEASSPQASIALAPWDPKTPYLAAMKKAGPEAAYRVYLQNRSKHGESPAFYLDCATYFFREGSREHGEQVLTNVLELNLRDSRLIRIVAHKLQQEAYLDLAVALFEDVLSLRPEEPQSYRDLALALADRGQRQETNADGVAAFEDYRRAAQLLHEVIVGAWDDRFPGIEVIALMELNRLLTRAANLEPGKSQELVSELDSRLKKLLDVDIRILISWDTDLTDIDGWIIEPSGEKCFYGHNRTTIGGMMTNDFTQGYGPEVYNLRRAMPGVYKFKAHFYGSSQQSFTGGTTIAATVITNYGRPNEKRRAITIRLSKPNEEVDIGSITFEN